MTKFTSTMSAPSHGGQLAKISSHFGIPESQLLDFSASLNPHGPPEEVLATLRKAVEDPFVISNYPDLQLRELRTALASYVTVEPACVAAANGVIPLLEASLHALEIKKCLLLQPAFGEYEEALRRADVEVFVSELTPDNAYRIRVDSVLATLEIEECDALLFANPQNPTGLAMTRDELRVLIAGAEERGVVVLLDEAFIDYLPGESVTDLTPQLANLVVFRSVTKFFAMAGLRVAYTVANSENITKIEAALPAWPVSTLAALAAMAAVQATGYIVMSRDANNRERNRCRIALESLGLKAFPGEANYLCFQLGRWQSVAAVWSALVAEHSIVLRRCDNYRGLEGEYLRSGIKLPHENDRLLSSLADVLR